MWISGWRVVNQTWVEASTMTLLRALIVTTSNSQRPVEQRLTALFNAQGQELWRYAKCRAPTDSAGDIAADVFLVAWRHGDDVQGDALP